MKREPIDGENVFVIRDFLSRQECERLIERGESIGFQTFNIDGEVFPGYRNNARVEMEDATLAATLWERAKAFVPVIDGQSAAGFHPQFRFYRYTGSEAFAPHYDGSRRVGERASKLTFLIYLTDVATGGETRFFGDDLQVKFVVPPECGKSLVFKHLILHEGVTVAAGTKYVLRTDVMYG